MAIGPDFTDMIARDLQYSFNAKIKNLKALLQQNCFLCKKYK